MASECIFCKIVKGKISSYKVYEDHDFLAFLDIAPLNRGHTLVLPRTHYRWTWDVPNFGEYWEAVRKIARAVMKATEASMVEFLTHGTDVHHAHIWIVPVFDGEEGFINASERKKFENGEMKKLTENIIKAL
jgi:histidine triad (HIT) family protein